MSILDVDRKEIDGRCGINLMTADHKGPLWKLLGDDEHKGIIPYITENGTLRYDGNFELIGHDNDCLGLYQAEGYINSVSCLFYTTYLTELDEWITTPHVYCNGAEIHTCGSIKNIHFVIDGSNDQEAYRKGARWKSPIMPAMKFNCLRKEFHFENTNIEFIGLEDPSIIYWSDCKLPRLTGLTSNCNVLNQWALFEFPPEYFQLFKPDYKCSVFDTEKNRQVSIPINSLDEAAAIAHDENRYHLLSHIIELRDNAKLSDILDLRGLPELCQVIVRNNTASLHFIKAGSICARPLSFARIPRTKSIPPSMGDLYPKTADGWYVIWASR